MRPELTTSTPPERSGRPADEFRSELLQGLRSDPKTVPCKFLYDERGSELFEAICGLHEYYPTRTEMSILREHAAEMAAHCGRACLLLEPGSGSSAKTRLLLDHLDAPVAYVPMDISSESLLRTAAELRRDYYPLEVRPLCADYHGPIDLPTFDSMPQRTVIFFPGSTIGNFAPQEAVRFLRRMANWCQPGDSLIIGVDLKKDPAVLWRAYNDSQGITAAFNLHLLERANAELGASFNLEHFQHRAIYNERLGRIEMHLVSLKNQHVRIARETFHFHAGEFVTTEHSYKYQLSDFRRLLRESGWQVTRTWTDPNRWFGVHLCERVR
jgi:dimethylhistidine N-methyltransferase